MPVLANTNNKYNVIYDVTNNDTSHYGVLNKIPMSQNEDMQKYKFCRQLMINEKNLIYNEVNASNDVEE